MPTPPFRSSKPPHWISPRPHTDAHQRYHTYGPIQPMDPEPRRGLLARIFGLHKAGM